MSPCYVVCVVVRYTRRSGHVNNTHISINLLSVGHLRVFPSHLRFDRYEDVLLSDNVDCSVLD